MRMNGDEVVQMVVAEQRWLVGDGQRHVARDERRCGTIEGDRGMAVVVEGLVRGWMG